MRARIQFEEVSKIFHRHTGQKLIRHHFRDWFRRNEEHDFYALKNVSFDIQEGERVAVVGRNGAGKSTLLSLVCGLGESIVEFSGIAEFIDEPLRTYSSGMSLRLAFSVALNLEPSILIVDEVLAVGDQAFQEKCFERIHQFRNSGRTLLCVSHSPSVLTMLCDRALWLDQGELMMDGKIEDVLRAYHGDVGMTPTKSVGASPGE